MGDEETDSDVGSNHAGTWGADGEPESAPSRTDALGALCDMAAEERVGVMLAAPPCRLSRLRLLRRLYTVLVDRERCIARMDDLRCVSRGGVHGGANSGAGSCCRYDGSRTGGVIDGMLRAPASEPRFRVGVLGIAGTELEARGRSASSSARPSASASFSRSLPLDLRGLYPARS